MITETQNQELTVNNQTSFPGLPAATTSLITSRISENYAAVTGIAIVTGSVPAAATGTLTIEQSVDGGNFDQIDSFSLTDGGAEVSFNITIVAKFLRVQFTTPVGTTMDLRLGGILKVES